MKKFVAAAILVFMLPACADQHDADDVFSPQFGKTTVSDPTASWHLPLDGTGLSFTSDGNFAANGNSIYANGVCGVTSKIFATTAASNSGDAPCRPTTRRIVIGNVRATHARSQRWSSRSELAAITIESRTSNR